MATVIDGAKIATEIRAELKTQITEWLLKGNRRPSLVILLIGYDMTSNTYATFAKKAAQDVGICCDIRNFPYDITEQRLINIINELNNNDYVDGILLQLPLPQNLNSSKICSAIYSDKDVDGFNEINVGRLCLDLDTFVPCAALGVQELLKRANIETLGKNAVVVGRSKHVGMPIAMLLHAAGQNITSGMNATVTICHEFTPSEDLSKICETADILITATGVPGLIKANMVKPGACVIDVGTTPVRDETSGQCTLIGDVDFEEVKKVAGYITPVPGGVGPVTITMLMKNTFMAANNQVATRSGTGFSI